MRDVIVDTCCLINLWAVRALVLPVSNGDVSKKMKAAARLPDMILHVLSNVEMEALYVFKPHEEDASRTRGRPNYPFPLFPSRLIDAMRLERWGRNGGLCPVRNPTRRWRIRSALIAKNRGWILATDDRPARKLAAQFHIPVLTTPEILKDWATRSGASAVEVAAVLSEIRRFANFFPNPKAPEADWWNRMIEDD